MGIINYIFKKKEEEITPLKRVENIKKLKKGITISVVHIYNNFWQVCSNKNLSFEQIRNNFEKFESEVNTIKKRYNELYSLLNNSDDFMKISLEVVRAYINFKNSEKINIKENLKILLKSFEIYLNSVYLNKEDLNISVQDFIKFIENKN